MEIIACTKQNFKIHISISFSKAKALYSLYTGAALPTIVDTLVSKQLPIRKQRHGEDFFKDQLAPTAKKLETVLLEIYFLNMLHSLHTK